MSMANSERNEGEPLDDKFIIRRIQNHVDNAINGEDGDVTNVRQNSYDRYMGMEYGNEREGYSRFTTREVLNAVEWALPALMRLFTGGVRPVSFKPVNAADVDQAKHETEVVSHWFYEGPEAGFLVIYSWIKDILLYPNGYVTVSPTEAEVSESEHHEMMPRVMLAMLEDEGAEVSIDAEYEDNPDVVDAIVTQKKLEKGIAVRPMPPDHMLIEHGWNQLNLDGCPFVCIREQKTYSDLRKDGYTADQLEDLGPQDDSETWNDEAVTRHFYEDESPDNDNEGAYDIQADETYWVHECYMHIDVDQDGISEPRKIVMVGCKILENEPCEFMPAVACTALPQTHKHIGMSIAEIVTDLQLLLTTLTRQLLDNIYKNNTSRKFIAQAAILTDNSTMDALLDGTSEVIPVRGNPNDAVMPEVTTPLVAEIGQVIEQVKDMVPARTGVAPDLTLDPSVLEKSTMGAFVGALDQASQRLELLARVVAECGLKPLFLKMHQALREHHNEATELEIAGQWVQVDPSKWKRRSIMNVNVGLGFNNKQMMLTLLESLLKLQKEVMPHGLTDPKLVYNTLSALIEQANLGDASTYFLDPKQPGWKAPPPQKDPAMIMAEAQAKALEAEAKRKDQEVKWKHEEVMAKIEADRAVAIEKARAEAAKLNIDLGKLKLDTRKTENERALNAAQITALNRDPKKAGEPAEDSSADEFAFASKKSNPGEGATT